VPPDIDVSRTPGALIVVAVVAVIWAIASAALSLPAAKTYDFLAGATLGPRKPVDLNTAVPWEPAPPRYTGDFVAPAGLKQPHRVALLKAARLTGPLAADRREMLDRLLAECGRKIAPAFAAASGDLDAAAAKVFLGPPTTQPEAPPPEVPQPDGPGVAAVTSVFPPLTVLRTAAGTVTLGTTTARFKPAGTASGKDSVAVDEETVVRGEQPGRWDRTLTARAVDVIVRRWIAAHRGRVDSVRAGVMAHLLATTPIDELRSSGGAAAPEVRILDGPAGFEQLTMLAMLGDVKAMMPDGRWAGAARLPREVQEAGEPPRQAFRREAPGDAGAWRAAAVSNAAVAATAAILAAVLFAGACGCRGSVWVARVAASVALVAAVAAVVTVEFAYESAARDTRFGGVDVRQGWSGPVVFGVLASFPLAFAWSRRRPSIRLWAEADGGRTSVLPRAAAARAEALRRRWLGGPTGFVLLGSAGAVAAVAAVAQFSRVGTPGGAWPATFGFALLPPAVALLLSAARSWSARRAPAAVAFALVAAALCGPPAAAFAQADGAKDAAERNKRFAEWSKLATSKRPGDVERSLELLRQSLAGDRWLFAAAVLGPVQQFRVEQRAPLLAMLAEAPRPTSSTDLEAEQVSRLIYWLFDDPPRLPPAAAVRYFAEGRPDVQAVFVQQAVERAGGLTDPSVAQLLREVIPDPAARTARLLEVVERDGSYGFRYGLAAAAYLATADAPGTDELVRRAKTNVGAAYLLTQLTPRERLRQPDVRDAMRDLSRAVRDETRLPDKLVDEMFTAVFGGDTRACLELARAPGRFRDRGQAMLERTAPEVRGLRLRDNGRELDYAAFALIEASLAAGRIDLEFGLVQLQSGNPRAENLVRALAAGMGPVTRKQYAAFNPPTRRIVWGLDGPFDAAAVRLPETPRLPSPAATQLAVVNPVNATLWAGLVAIVAGAGLLALPALVGLWPGKSPRVDAATSDTH
jgi:hypothetical protein